MSDGIRRMELADCLRMVATAIENGHTDAAYRLLMLTVIPGAVKMQGRQFEELHRRERSIDLLWQLLQYHVPDLKLPCLCEDCLTAAVAELPCTTS